MISMLLYLIVDVVFAFLVVQILQLLPNERVKYCRKNYHKYINMGRYRRPSFTDIKSAQVGKKILVSI